MKPEKTRKILLINPLGIGDVLFTTPVLMALKTKYPDAQIGYWCNERAQGLFTGDPLIQEVFALSRGDLMRLSEGSYLAWLSKFYRLFRALRQARFDTAINFTHDTYYNIIAGLAGIKVRVGYNYQGKGRFLTDPVRSSGFSGRHVVEHYLDLLKPLGIERPAQPALRLHVADSAHAKAQHMLSRMRALEANMLIGIAGGVGTSWGKDAGFKQWPAVKFAKLADDIHEKSGATVVLLGSESDRPIANVITRMAQHKPVDLVGRTSLEQLAAVMSYLRVLVTNDGGPLHIAVALRVKTVSIFGPVDSVVYGPYPAGADHIVIQRDLPCRPCYQNFRLPLCKQERECISGIETSEVFEAVRRLLT